MRQHETKQRLSCFKSGPTSSSSTLHAQAGPDNPSQADWGVNVRALNDLFGLGSERAQTMRYEVGVQMVEIYNEQVRDLLDSTGTGPRSYPLCAGLFSCSFALL